MTIKQQKLLIVDDELVNVEILHELFQDDYEVFFATNGEDAITLTERQLPDLILLDIMMPDVDGREVCARLKANLRTQDIPIIFVTAMGSELDEEAGLGLGAVDYVTKPIHPAAVQLRVNNQMELKQHRDRLEELVVFRTWELEAAKEAAEAGNRAKHEFLMVVSHALRTPLNAIIGFSEFMVSSGSDEAVKEQAQPILRAGLKMLDLVNDLLDLVSVEPEAEYQAVPLLFYVPELLEELQAFVVKRAGKKGLSFAVEVDPSLPKSVMGDKKRLFQVLAHLLKNAVEFTESGTIRLELLPPVEAASPDAILFRVTDTGQGISPERQEMIFQQFTQVDMTKTRAVGGLGLGLTICKRFVGLLGGRIWVESALDKGSVFSFTAILPEAKASVEY